MRCRRGWDYPLHLGVTEAGEGEDGRMKSAIGIGALLMDGLGDTIRVSLTEDPEFELSPCSNLAEVRCRNSQVVGNGIAGHCLQALVVPTTTIVQNRRMYAVSSLLQFKYCTVTVTAALLSIHRFYCFATLLL